MKKESQDESVAHLLPNGERKDGDATKGRIDFKGMWDAMSDQATVSQPAQAAQVTDAFAVLEKLGWEWVNGRWCADISDPATHPHSPDAADSGRVIDAKYSNVLMPFVRLMAKELHANAGKGDRPGWLTMTPAVGMLEIYYHASKLQKAVKNGNAEGIREYAADVANMAMMLLDVCGGLDVDEAALAAQGQSPPAQAILTLEGGFQVPITRSGDGYICDWLKAPPASPAGVPDVVEQIAAQWDGCMYDAVGETLDIGECIRAAGKLLSTAPSATPEGGEVGL